MPCVDVAYCFRCCTQSGLMSVCVLGTRVSCAKTAEMIMNQYGMSTCVGLRNRVLEVQITQSDGAVLRRGQKLGHIEYLRMIACNCLLEMLCIRCVLSMQTANECIRMTGHCGGDVAYCHVTLNTTVRYILFSQNEEFAPCREVTNGAIKNSSLFNSLTFATFCWRERPIQDHYRLLCWLVQESKVLLTAPAARRWFRAKLSVNFLSALCRTWNQPR